MRIGETWKRHSTRWGVIAALVALLLWPAYALLQDPLRVPFMTALLATSCAGASILIIAVVDLATVRRSRHARPARAFDLALGAALTVPALVALIDLLE